MERADKLVTLLDTPGKRHKTRLLRLLRSADALLRARLEAYNAVVGPKGRFELADILSYRAQIQIVTDVVDANLLGIVLDSSDHAVSQGTRRTVDMVVDLEKEFRGVVRPLRLEEAMNMDVLQKRTKASLLRQHETSVKRYGAHVIGKMEQTMQVGLLAGRSRDDMKAAIRPHTDSAYAAERIVRTETAAAYNTANLDAIDDLDEEDEDETLYKKILAHFDNRTAPDSVFVHGQIRRKDLKFRDGAGRTYLKPPGRPNDRETIIPWYKDWPEDEDTRRLPKSERRRIIMENKEARRSRTLAPSCMGVPLP